jgi:hypothetical protein
LDAAKARVVELSVARPGEYFIFSQRAKQDYPSSRTDNHPIELKLQRSDDRHSDMSPGFDVFKVAQNGVPLEAAEDLDVAISRAIGLRENFPGEYLIASQATGRQIVFTANGGIKRS